GGTSGANTGFSSFFSKPPAPQTAQTPSFFGNTQAQIPQPHASSTLPSQSKSFFNTASSAQSSFPIASQPVQANISSGSSSSTKSELYTPLTGLSEEDKIAFERMEFTLIPLLPPPLELCF